jgi:glutathione reductase (NADPH)
VEFAGIFAGLGVETTLIYRGPNILRGFDDDVRAHLAGRDREARHQGHARLPARRRAIEKTATGLVNALSQRHEIETDVVMFATGRVPYVKDLGLEGRREAERAGRDRGRRACRRPPPTTSGPSATSPTA